MINPYYRDFAELEEEARDVQIPVTERNYDVVKLDKHINQMKSMLAELADAEEPEALTHIAEEVADELSVPIEGVEQTLRAYNWSNPPDNQVTQVASRLVGNIASLNDRMAILPWTTFNLPRAWTLCRVAAVTDNCHTAKGERGFELTVSCYTGFYAGRDLKRILKSGKEISLAHSLGAGWKVAELFYAPELIGMSGFVLMEPGLQRQEIPYFARIHVTQRQKKTNMRLYNDRLDDSKCPYHLKPQTYRQCLDCHIGHERVLDGQRCKYAVRRKTSAANHANEPSATAG